MKQRVLLERHDYPEIVDFKKIFEGTYGKFEELMFLVNMYKKKWSFYKGWSLKVVDKKKALFYLIPFHGSFDINMAIRESEKETFLNDDDFKDYNNELLNGEKYPEGVKMHFEVTDEKSYNYLEKFLKGLIEFR